MICWNAMSGLNILTSFLPVIFAIALNEIRAKWFKNLIQTLTTLPNFLHHHLEPLQPHEFAFGQRDRRLVIVERVDPAEQRHVAEQEHEHEQRRHIEPQFECMLLVDRLGADHLRGLLRLAALLARQLLARGVFGGLDLTAHNRFGAAVHACDYVERKIIASMSEALLPQGNAGNR